MSISSETDILKVRDADWVFHEERDKMKLNRTTLRSVEILKLVSKRPDGITLDELCDSLNLPKTSAYDIVTTLAETGMIRNADDTPPYLGIGLVGKSRTSKKEGIVYRAKVYAKIQFKEPNDENTTKQESTTFNHTTMEGNLFVLPNGDWKSENEFDSLEAAKAFVDKILGIGTEDTGAQS